MIRHDAIQDASLIVIGKENRLGNSGHVVRKLRIMDEKGTLFEMDILSRDGVLPVICSKEVAR